MNYTDTVTNLQMKPSGRYVPITQIYKDKT